MDAGLGKQTGDIVSANKGSAQESYYRFMLLKEKLAAQSGNADELLRVQSEREKIEMDILRNLIKITESSPEFSQVVDITGSRDRYEQARILSEVVYDKVRAETILGFYTPDKSFLQNHFDTRTTESLSVRQAATARLAASRGGGGSATAGIQRALAEAGAPVAPPAEGS